MDFTYLTILISIVICSGYLSVKWIFSYWKRNKIPYVQPTFPFGNLKVIKSDEHIALQLDEYYKIAKSQNQSSLFGLYLWMKPALLITDVDLVRRIFITDFNFFQNRNVFYNEKDDPLSAHLFNVGYDKWRPLRTKLTPTFTSGKMKFMFPTIVSVADEFVKCLNHSIRTDSEIEMYDWLGRFTTDVIGTCAFGIECNSLKDPEAIFRRMSRKVFDVPKTNYAKRFLVGSFKNLAKVIGVHSQHKDVTKFFLDIVTQNVSYRETNNIQRNDFMSLLIDLKNSKNAEQRLTINEIAAQAYIFFLAGFETSSNTLAYSLYELALDEHKHIQDEARQEIVTVLEKHNGILTFEALSEMSFAEQILNETLRKHSTGAIITRVTNKDYQVPKSHFVIPKGMALMIPIHSIHHDPDLYENPEEFDPTRFSPERSKLRPSCSFIPFGDGPRNCIGLRFAILEAKIGLVKLLQNFEISVCSKTQIPLKYSAKKMLLSPEDSVWLKITKIDDYMRKSA